MTALNSLAASLPHALPGAIRRDGRTPVTTLADTKEIVAEDDKGKWDTLVPRGELALRDGKLALPVRSCDEDMRLSLSPWATGQLCTRLGMPASYFRRCPAILQDEQANHWFKNGLTTLASPVDSPEACTSVHDQICAGGKGSDVDDDKNVLPWRLRVKNDRLRAILSSRYSPLDNGTVMEALMPLLHDRHRVDWFGLSPESFHLRVIDPLRTRDILPGDAIAVGIHIANSEVGFRSITVDALVYRLICSNGLIGLDKGKSVLRQRHMHLEQTRFVTALENAVAGALVTAEASLEQLQKSAQVRIPDVEGAIERYGNLWNLSENTTETAKTMLLSEPAQLQDTLYGVLNAFTSAAQLLPNDQRYDLEVLAGQLASNNYMQLAPRALARSREHALGVSDPVGAVARAKELFGAEVVGSHVPSVSEEH